MKQLLQLFSFFSCSFVFFLFVKKPAGAAKSFHMKFFRIVIFVFCIRWLQATDDNDDIECIPGTGKKERRNINLCKTVFSAISIVCKMIPLIIALSMTVKTEKYFTTLRDSHCSDDGTMEIFKEMSDVVLHLREKDEQTLLVDCLMLLYTVGSWIYLCVTGCKGHGA